MKTNKLRQYRKISYYLEGIFTKNIVLFYGLSLTCIVAAVTSVRNAIALSIAMSCALIPSVVVSSLLPKMEEWLRTVILAFTAMLFIYASAFIIKTVDPTVFESLGMYFPLMVVTSAVAVKADQHKSTNKPLVALLDSVINCLGYFFAAFTVGAFREILTNGTFMGKTINVYMKIPAFGMTFGGFIVLAFISAGVRFIDRLAKTMLFKSDNKNIKTH